MTTIFIDFKKKKIVADRQGTCSLITTTAMGSKVEPVGRSYLDVSKILRLENGAYFVGSGDVAEFHRQYARVINTGTVDLQFNADVTVARVRPKGKGLSVDVWTTTKVKGIFKDSFKLSHNNYQSSNFICFGSGSQYAIGAFRAGKSAEDSVRIASMCDEYTGYEIDVIQL